MIGLPLNWRVVEHLGHSVRTGEPSLPRVAPEGFWAHFEQHPDQARIFDAAMTAKAGAHIAAVLASYDFSSFQLVVDVGGGRGHLLQAVLEATHSTRGVLFDLPHVVEAARGAVSHARLTFQGGDFFPDALPRADGYLLMEVLHDWTDEEAGKILQAVRDAAAPGARLLIVETVPPPDPGPAWAKILDLLMLALFAGKQRTAQNMRRCSKPAPSSCRARLTRGRGYRCLKQLRSRDCECLKTYRTIDSVNCWFDLTRAGIASVTRRRPMTILREHVEQHYGRGRIVDSIIAALRETGKDLARLKPEDLAPVDEFHVRGREATIELARRAALWWD